MGDDDVGDDDSHDAGDVVFVTQGMLCSLVGDERCGV